MATGHGAWIIFPMVPPVMLIFLRTDDVLNAIWRGRPGTFADR
jgi:hypothetical protein